MNAAFDWLDTITRVAVLLAIPGSFVAAAGIVYAVAVSPPLLVSVPWHLDTLPTDGYALAHLPATCLAPLPGS